MEKYLQYPSGKAFDNPNARGKRVDNPSMDDVRYAIERTKVRTFPYSRFSVALTDDQHRASYLYIDLNMSKDVISLSATFNYVDDELTFEAKSRRWTDVEHLIKVFLDNDMETAKRWLRERQHDTPSDPDAGAQAFD